MARPITKTDNTEVKAFLNTFEDVYDQETMFETIPMWIEDCIYGAKGQVSAGTRKLSTYRIFTLLRQLDEISTKTVGDLLNRRRMAVHGEEYSKRMIEYYTAALRCASQALAHHKRTHHVDVETGEIEEVLQPTVVYTEEQKQKMRLMAIAGNLDGLETYIKEINND